MSIRDKFVYVESRSEEQTCIGITTGKFEDCSIQIW